MKTIIISSRLGKIKGYSDGRIAYFDLYDSKEVDVMDLKKPFIKLQEFLGKHLHKGRDFPPEVIKPFLLA
jgi:hypothetical protein